MKMKKCLNCNQDVENNTTTCPYCGYCFVLNDEKEKKQREWPWGIIGVLCPIIGLILYLLWKDSEKKRASAIGIGTIIGFVLWCIVIIPLIFVIKILVRLLGLIF